MNHRISIVALSLFVITAGSAILAVESVGVDRDPANAPGKPQPGNIAEKLPQKPAQVAQKPVQKSALSINLVARKNNGRSIIRLSPGTKSVQDIRSHFHVVVTNNTNKPVRLWQERCSWGYYNLSFEVIDAGGKKHTIKKRWIKAWSADAAIHQTLAPGKHRVIDVYFDNLNAKSIYGWNLDSLLKKAKANLRFREIKIRPVFEIEPDKRSKKQNVWTGKIIGEYQKAVLTNFPQRPTRQQHQAISITR